MTRRLLAATLLLIVPCTAIAHQDPLGDVYPRVKVENGNFAIYFFNNSRQANSSEYDMSGNNPVYRMVYSPTGKLLGPRAACPALRSDALWQGASMVYGRKISLQNERVIFDPDLLRSKPSYLIERNGKTEHRRLPWPEEIKIDDVADVLVDERSLLVSATTPDRLLRLFCFDRAKFESPAMAVVGEPAFIYDFPRASKVILAAGRYWLSWVRFNQAKGKYETVLSSWKPGEEKPRATVLETPSDFNTELSMAAIGDRLCVAYHCSIGGAFFGSSQIITAFPAANP